MASHWPKLLNPLKYERYGLVNSESVNHSKVPISVPVLEMLDIYLNIVIDFCNIFKEFKLKRYKVFTFFWSQTL